MDLKSIFQRKPDRAAASSANAPADQVQQARVRARRRLIGAVVLVVIGVIGFPLLFETQPRPIPVDIPIIVPRRDGAPPLAMPSPRPFRSAAAASAQHEPLGATEVAEASSEAARNPVAAKPPSPEKSESSGSAAKSASAVAPPAPSGGAASSSTSGEVKRAQAASDAKVVDKAPSERGGHFVVQVGAFADVSSAREVRQKLEKLGLKSYTEVTETTGGHRVRVRVGPYATREEADRALAKIRSSGAAAVLMTL